MDGQSKNSNTMAEFSYADDIAPMRGDFFNTGPLSSRERMSLQKQYGPQITELQNNIAKLEGERFRMRAADLAYERSMFEFEQAKEKARRDREEIEQLSGLSETLQGIVDDPNKTPFEKSQELNRMRMRVPPRGAATSSLFQGAFGAVDAQAKQAKPSWLMYNVAQVGDTDLALQMAQRDGVISPEEEDLIRFSELNETRRTQKAEADRLGEQKDALAAASKSEMSYLDKIVTDVKGINKTKPVTLSEDAPSDLRGAILEGKTEAPKVFAANDIEMLKSYARILYRDEPSALRAILNQDDGDVIKGTLLTKIRKRQKELSITASAAPKKSAGDPFFK